MTIVWLDRSEVEARIIRGDNCQGRHILAVAPDGSAHELLWEERSRSWNDYPSDWLVAHLPAVFPEGLGRVAEEARSFLCSWLDPEALAAAERRHEEEAIGWADLVREIWPQEWEACLRLRGHVLAEEWLAGLNGEPSDLDMTAPWGGVWTEKGYWEPIEFAACFEWAEEGTTK